MQCKQGRDWCFSQRAVNENTGILKQRVAFESNALTKAPLLLAG